MDVTTLRYDCDLEALTSQLAARFVTLAEDDETRAFVAAAQGARPSALRSGAFALFRRFMSDYDAYGRLGMYRMHLLGAAQWRTLLQLDGASDDAWLDLGAGRGDATAALHAHFTRRSAIEPARALRSDLRRRGFSLLDVDACHEALPSGERYGLITCLNVIDRVTHPRTLVRNAMAALQPGGRLVLSVPLPVRPHVDRGGGTVAQEEPLPRASGDGFEAQVNALAERFLRPLDLEILALSRVPYLSTGDTHAPYYALDAAVLVCTPG